MKKFFSTPVPYLILIALVFLVSYLRSFGRLKRLRENHIVICGQIVGMSSGKGINIIYDCTVNGEKKEFNRPCPKLTYENYKRGINKIYIVVEKGNSNLSDILSGTDEFEKYNVKSEDTLNVLCK